jgi:polyphenol oxidase
MPEPGAQPRWLEANWPAPAGVRVLSSWRAGGVSGAPYAALNLGTHVGDQASAVLENRRRLHAAASLPNEPRWLNQVHGTVVADLDRHEPGRLPSADAAVTRMAGTVCAILTADCLPLVFASQSGAVVGAAHAGWRGLAAGVIEATVDALRTPADEILAWLGPAIGAANFEVGAEVRAAFCAPDSGAGRAFVLNARGRFQADLYRLARRRLETLGVTRIYGEEQCTFAQSSRYFSHRRDGVTGRQATLIWRADA